MINSKKDKTSWKISSYEIHTKSITYKLYIVNLLTITFIYNKILLERSWKYEKLNIVYDLINCCLRLIWWYLV